jgi:hypothetical protein
MAEAEKVEDTGEAGDEIKNDTVLTGEENSDAEKKDDTTGHEDGEKTNDEKADADDGPKDGAADKGEDGKVGEYQDFTTPEGVEINQVALAEFLPIVQEMGATQEQAQALVDLQLKFSQDAMDAQNVQWAGIRQDWRDAAESDTEYGKGAYDASVLTARKAMREVGEPALLKALEDTGMGDHPEFIRFFYRVGKLIEEDSVTLGGSKMDIPKSQADRLYPNQGKKG